MSVQRGSAAKGDRGPFGRRLHPEAERTRRRPLKSPVFWWNDNPVTNVTVTAVKCAILTCLAEKKTTFSPLNRVSFICKQHIENTEYLLNQRVKQ